MVSFSFRLTHLISWLHQLLFIEKKWKGELLPPSLWQDRQRWRKDILGFRKFKNHKRINGFAKFSIIKKCAYKWQWTSKRNLKNFNFPVSVLLDIYHQGISKRKASLFHKGPLEWTQIYLWSHSFLITIELRKEHLFSFLRNDFNSARCIIICICTTHMHIHIANRINLLFQQSHPLCSCLDHLCHVWSFVF